MFKIKDYFYILIVTFFITPSANSALLIDPYLGAHLLGSIDNQDREDANSSGFGVGSRVGGTFLDVFMFGYDFGMHEFEADFAGSDTSHNILEHGLFGGFNLLGFFRVYAVYIFSSQVSLEPNNNATNTASYSSGEGSKLGVGWYLLPGILTMNLEYRAIKYTSKKTTADLEQPLSDPEKFNSIFINLSLPLSF